MLVDYSDGILFNEHISQASSKFWSFSSYCESFNSESLKKEYFLVFAA